MGTPSIQDDEYRAVGVRSVEPCKGGWSITDDEGWSLFVTSEACSVAPEPGETALMYGRGVGFPVRGIVIGERVYRYRTKAEARWDGEQAAAQAKRKKTADYEAAREEFERRAQALPEPLRRRIAAFRERGGDEWRHEFEPYEMFVCEQAVVLRAALCSREEMVRFQALPYESQRAEVSGLSGEHSGNTFGAALALAAALVDAEEAVPRMHGALCPLVGCREYGCWAASSEVSP